MKKILLAECNAFLISVYVSELRKLGHSISIAPDGEIALNRIKNINPDLLILASTLPANGGFATMKTIRQDLGLTDLKVVMLSDFISEYEEQRSLELGILKNLVKVEHTAFEIAQEVKKILS